MVSRKTTQKNEDRSGNLLYRHDKVYMIQLLENGAGNFLPSPTASFAYQANVRFCA